MGSTHGTIRATLPVVVDDFMGDLARTLEGEQPARARVLAWVRLFDLALAGPYSPSAPPRVALTVAMIAAGRALLDSGILKVKTTVVATVEAAERYVLAPGEATWSAYQCAATASYPFGSGEGCYSVRELGSECARGSGCPSGSGSIAGIAESIGDARVVDAVRPALRAWCASTS